MRRIVRTHQRGGDSDLGAPWLTPAEERHEAELKRLQQNQEAAEREKLARELKRAERQERKLAESKPVHAVTTSGPAPAPLPSVPMRFESPRIELQETALPLSDLNRFRLLEKASLWWVSNQTDNLLCLPYCRIERLEYQIRTALRVLGPLRGRALLSDEVGLGKTIEAGLILKELLTRGIVKRFLVLTVPSLVDQWEEELNDKFGLEVTTTNRNSSRGGRFWEDNPAIVASLHTLKQPGQLEVARQVKWDMLVVDEAHYLRNRESQAWQACRAPARFPVPNPPSALPPPAPNAPDVAWTSRLDMRFVFNRT